MIPKLDISNAISRALRELEQNTPLTDTSRGSTLRAIIEATCAVEHRYARDVISALSLRMLSGTSGIGLDLLGDVLGVRRRSGVNASASASEKICKFYTKGGTFGNINAGPFTIPAGTTVYLREHAENGPGNVVRVTEDVICNIDEDHAWFSCESELRGSKGTVGRGSMIAHSFTGYDDAENNTLLVENVSPIIGEDAESDDMYRSRIANERHRRGSDNALAIELAAMSVPGIANAMVVGFEAGAGTSTCLVTSVVGRAGPALVAKVERAIRMLENPFSQTITVDEPEYVGVELYTRVKFKDGITGSKKAELLRAAELNVKREIGNLMMGDGISINSLSSTIISSLGNTITDVGTPGNPIEQHWVWRETQDGRRYRNVLYGNYIVEFDQRLIVEDSILNPVRVVEW